MKPVYKSVAAGDVIYQAKDDANSVFNEERFGRKTGN